MEEYTLTEKRIDTACLVMFPMGFVILALLANAGYSPAFFADTYVVATEVISAIVVMSFCLRSMGIPCRGYQDRARRALCS